MSTAERRSDVRIKTAFEVVNAIPPLEGIAELRDVSAGGACLEGTSARPALGQAVQLTVRLSDRQPPLVLVGKVVRHAETGFALMFEKPSPQLERLFQYEPPPEQGGRLESRPTRSPQGREAAAQRGEAERSVGPREGLQASEGGPLRGSVLEKTLPAAPARPAAKRLGVSAYREVLVDCCASSQWISGRICTLPTRSLLDHLNLGDPFLRLVDAVAPHEREPMAFIALRSDAVDLILPAEGQDAIDTEVRIGRIVERPIKCLLPYAVLEGTIGVLDKIRVSDHLMRCGGFISVRDCRVRLAKGQRAPRDISLVAFALVNLRRVIGVSDLVASPPPPDEPLDTSTPRVTAP